MQKDHFRKKKYLYLQTSDVNKEHQCNENKIALQNEGNLTTKNPRGERCRHSSLKTLPPCSRPGEEAPETPARPYPHKAKLKQTIRSQFTPRKKHAECNGRLIHIH